MGHGCLDTLSVDVHTAVFTAHTLLYDPPQEVVADFTPRGTLVVMYLGGNLVGGGRLGEREGGGREQRREVGGRDMYDHCTAVTPTDTTLHCYVRTQG